MPETSTTSDGSAASSSTRPPAQRPRSGRFPPLAPGARWRATIRVRTTDRGDADRWGGPAPSQYRVPPCVGAFGSGLVRGASGGGLPLLASGRVAARSGAVPPPVLGPLVAFGARGARRAGAPPRRRRAGPCADHLPGRGPSRARAVHRHLGPSGRTLAGDRRSRDPLLSLDGRRRSAGVP